MDDWRTYLSANDTRHVEDVDLGRPAELFGAGFRGGYTAATYPEDGPFGPQGGGIGVRNAYAAGFDSSGGLIDVSNNVGKKDEEAFEAIPFAVGVAEGMEAGALVPSGTKMVFDVAVSDGDIAGYLAKGLNDGALRFVATSLVAGSFSRPNYPQFYTKENTLAAPDQMPSLDIVVQVAKSAPTLQVSSIQNGKTRFSWPQPSERYEVERAGSLTENESWFAQPGTLTSEGGIATLEIDSSEASGFFRLRRAL